MFGSKNHHLIITSELIHLNKSSSLGKFSVSENLNLNWFMLSFCEAMITCCCISLCCEVTGPLLDPLPPTSPASAHLEVHSLLIHSSTRPQPDNSTEVPGPTSSNVRRISNDITNSSTCTAATVFLYSENVKTVKQHTHTHTERLWQGYKIHNETKCRMPN